MVRNIVILGGSSHPELVENICSILGVPASNRILSKFASGETRCEIRDSVRGKDVYIIQTGSGDVNDHLMELCIMISACKIGSAKKITAVIPLFPYSRQPDVPYHKTGAPLNQNPNPPKNYTFESVPPTPGPSHTPKNAAGGLKINGVDGLHQKLANATISESPTAVANGEDGFFAKPERPTTPVRNGMVNGHANGHTNGFAHPSKKSSSSSSFKYTTHDYENQNNITGFQARPGYKQWIAQAGTLVADLLICAGADHVISMELHDPQYQGFLDCPFDNLYGKPTLQRYITERIPEWREAVIVSPDAGGAKRATAIADALSLDFSLIHKERRPTKFTEHRNATMMLVGDVRNKVCILVDDIVDTANTITRAAKLLKKEGALKIYALLTHGVLSGDAIARINASPIDKMIVTNSVPQDESRRLCPKMEVLDISPILAEAIRRSHHGESISVLFQYA
ncbi:probable PRS5 - ribose-phosphate pyrophosphokinases [Cephalotrichum gorgonifer]|uniref:Probable PRS5 - ribose-phosphate pyrophosphokinases n=1 Tax=Cephalotrichum gorgonifer TaxID=2041049 RepID=A0AAE8MRU9_9PEZI|nr:probable PRS5 - ribose-phosphate pyrophosphokinases [Cephalotrichum gorgonifer]